MAKVLVDKDFLEDGLELICDKIRLKTGGTGVLAFPVEIASAVESIEGSGGITPTGTKSITENGTYDVTSFASAEVDVPEAIPALMDGGRELADGHIAVRPTTSRSIVINDQNFDGTNVVGCYLQRTPSHITTEQSKYHALLIIPTQFSSLTGGLRAFGFARGIGDDMYTGPEAFVGQSGFSFTVGAHSLSVTLPETSAYDFITDKDYWVYPIRGNGRV